MPPRIAALDIVRGVVMVLMAIDHVRVYSGVAAGGPTAGVFLTRWVTHFCAPAFVFLAGTSAFLHGLKLNAAPALARYLVGRGLLLVLLELTVIRAAWTFGVDYSQFILAGVIWMLGWCMVLLAALIHLPTSVIGAIGLIIIVGQHAFGALGRALPSSWQSIWEFVYPVGAEVTLGANGPSVAVLYSIVPWIGVMAAGYAFGAIMVRPPHERDRLCLRIGLAMTALFVVIGGLEIARQTTPADTPAWMRLLNQRKYPASVPFLLMTLGPTVAVMPVADRARGLLANALATFGRVPMFYYLLHIPVIHAVSLLVWLARDGRAGEERFATAPFVSIPEPERWSLALLYAVFVFVIAILYVPSRWYARLRATHPQRWMRYL